MNKCKGRIVKVQHSSAASKNGLIGDYYMNISSGCITLTTVESLREAIMWPIQHITKFKSEDLTRGENLLTLEANLFCSFAAGSYQFKTFHGRELIKSVKDAALNTQYIIVDSPHSNTKSPHQVSYKQSNGSKQTINHHNSRNLIPHTGLTDDIGSEKRRDSGFSDSETDNHMNNHQDNRHIDENHNSLHSPPPLPPKKSRDSCKIVYMDYNEAKTEESTPEESTPPPLPERQFRK